MAEGKWISDLTTETPLEDAARWVLTVRLEVIRDYLRLSLREPEQDVEYIHQLRVGTRRAGAALDLFALCLPDRAYRRARKELRGLRRAAGAARDWDVFLESLHAPETPWTAREEPAIDFLVGYALAQRTDAQRLLVEATPDFPFSFERTVAELLGAVRPPRSGEGRTLLDLARPLLTGLLEELDEATRQDLNDYDQLHQVRIVGKRLRYAMEVFASCFGPAFREQLYPAVEKMQEILGNANDSHVGSQRLEGIRGQLQAFQPEQWKRIRPGLDKLLRFHQRRLPKERQRFLDWWHEWEETKVEKAFSVLLRSSPALPLKIESSTIVPDVEINGSHDATAQGNELGRNDGNVGATTADEGVPIGEGTPSPTGTATAGAAGGTGASGAAPVASDVGLTTGGPESSNGSLSGA